MALPAQGPAAELSPFLPSKLGMASNLSAVGYHYLK